VLRALSEHRRESHINGALRACPPPFLRRVMANGTKVDVMPFLGRTDYGGPFNAYYEALANLGAEYVRYAPW